MLSGVIETDLWWWLDVGPGVVGVVPGVEFLEDSMFISFTSLLSILCSLLTKL